MLPWSRASNSRQSSTDEGPAASSSAGSSSASSSVLPTSASSSSNSNPQASPSPPLRPPSSSSSTTPSTYLARHHRNSSSTQSASSARSTTKLRRAGGGSSMMPKSDAQAIATDNDPWQEQSDDEDDTIASIRRNVQFSLSVSAASGSGSGGGGGQHKERSSSPPAASGGSGGATTAGGGGSWSFNPFSIVGGGSSKSNTHTLDESYAPTQRAGPDAVAAALNSVGRGRPPPTPMSTATTTSSSTFPHQRGAKRSVSYLATASKVQAEADQKIDEAARERKASATSLKEGSSSTPPPPTTTTTSSASSAVSLADAPPNTSQGPTVTVTEEGLEQEEETEATRAKKSSTSRIEQCRRHIRPEVNEIVRDPISVLGRLAEPPPPPPPDSPVQPRKSTSSIGDRSPAVPPMGGENDDDDADDVDPAKGYIQLDATNISSGGPEIVEFNRFEDPEENGELGRERRRRRKFIECLGAETVDLAALRTLAWAGIPNELRPMAWQLLMGYMPAPSARRVSTLARKRQEYADAVRLAFSRGVKGLDGPIWHQISIDVPRTNPGIQLWQCEGTQKSLERILYVWAIRHPASGYVQGINDLVTPFFQVFLSSYIDSDPETYDVAALPPAVLEALEADSFWCLSKLLDGIQDNYIFAQPGITRQVARMKELCARVDAPLAHHLEENSVEFIQFAFRWMNCLLMREMSVKNIVRMWDTYLAEGQDAFSEFHLYVCLAFLVRWSDRLREMDFQSIIMFLQSLPTQQWSDKNTELLLSEAFMWSRTFVAR